MRIFQGQRALLSFHHLLAPKLSPPNHMLISSHSKCSLKWPVQSSSDYLSSLMLCWDPATPTFIKCYPFVFILGQEFPSHYLSPHCLYVVTLDLCPSRSTLILLCMVSYNGSQITTFFSIYLLYYQNNILLLTPIKTLDTKAWVPGW